MTSEQLMEDDLAGILHSLAEPLASEALDGVLVQCYCCDELCEPIRQLAMIASFAGNAQEVAHRHDYSASVLMGSEDERRKLQELLVDYEISRPMGGLGFGGRIEIKP